MKVNRKVCLLRSGKPKSIKIDHLFAIVQSYEAVHKKWVRKVESIFAQAQMLHITHDERRK